MTEKEALNEAIKNTVDISWNIVNWPVESQDIYFKVLELHIRYVRDNDETAINELYQLMEKVKRD